jgi:hypothetical protein
VPETGGYFLVGHDGELRTMRLPVKAPVLVGRGEYNNLVLGDSRLSRQHSRVAIESGTCVVYDLNSANGTFVNGVPVRRQVVSPDDVISFGPCEFRLVYEAGTDALPEDVDEPTLSGRSCEAEALALMDDVRLRDDLALAGRIQKSFLPREVIAVEGIDLFAEYRAAYTVGGDFYDVLWVGTDRLGVFTGDVSGKGIAAALLMARLSSELRIAALAQVEPVEVLATMNDAMLARGQTELFFTAIYFTLDVKTGEIVLANAGHPPPYWRRADGSVEPVSGGRGCAVGILEDAGFNATRLELGHGDSLVLYTDGVVEASSMDGSFYGQERLEACLSGPGPRAPSVIAEQILRSVDTHAAGGPVIDDLTLLICQRSLGGRPTMQPRRRSSSFPAPPVRKI